MRAQRLDVLPPVVAPEGEIDSDDDDESIIGMADEVDDVGESDEAVDTEEADITSVTALVQKIELSEQAVVAPPEPHVETRSKRAISEVASGSVEDPSHHADEEGVSEIRDNAAGMITTLMSLDDDDDNQLPIKAKARRHRSDAPLCAMSPESVSKLKTVTKRAAKMRLKRGITMDTGAHHNVMPRRMAGKRAVTQSPGSKRGMHYVAAGNERIPNEGEINFDFESQEGHKETFVFQIAAVNKALGSVAYVVDGVQGRVRQEHEDRRGHVVHGAQAHEEDLQVPKREERVDIGRRSRY